MGPVTPEPMSLREYAKRRGISAMTVSRAVAKGRLVKSVVRDAQGVPKIADPVLADQEWDANTDYTHAPAAVIDRLAPKVAAAASTAAEEDDDGEPVEAAAAAVAVRVGGRALLPLGGESAAEPGRWHTLPYQRGIMDAITDPTVEQVT
jgi:hypothetical protein